MQHFLLVYHVVADYVERRAPFREDHLRLAGEARDRGEIVMGGALADPVDKALIVFRCEDRKTVEAFVHCDPYVRNGLVEKWEIRPWTVVIS
jgi:uncharacterized protein